MDNIAMKEYVDKIKEISQGHIGTSNMEMYEIPYYSGNISVKLYLVHDEYCSFCEYQKHDDVDLICPTTWIQTSLKNFCESFVFLQNVNPKIMTFKEIKSKKVKKIGEVLSRCPVCIDGDNVLYLGKFPFSKISKLEKEHKQLLENANSSVLIRYRLYAQHNNTSKWFVDLDSAKSFVIAESKKVQQQYDCGNMTIIEEFKVVKHGYDEISPLDKKWFVRLSYFNLDVELKTTNKPTCCRRWYKSMSEYVSLSVIEEVIDCYIKYKAKKGKIKNEIL